jgi:hypothetical protein
MVPMGKHVVAFQAQPPDDVDDALLLSISYIRHVYLSLLIKRLNTDRDERS